MTENERISDHNQDFLCTTTKIKTILNLVSANVILMSVHVRFSCFTIKEGKHVLLKCQICASYIRWLMD